MLEKIKIRSNNKKITVTFDYILISLTDFINIRY